MTARWAHRARSGSQSGYGASSHQCTRSERQASKRADRSSRRRRWATIHSGLPLGTSTSCGVLQGFLGTGAGLEPASSALAGALAVKLPCEEKQNPVLSVRTPRLVCTDIRRGLEEGSVCLVCTDIGTALRCLVCTDISRFPSPTP